MHNAKKAILAAILLIGGAGMAQAGPFTFGIKAGLNVNKLKFNESIASSSNSCGWTAGVMADFTVPIIGIGGDVSVMYSRMNNGSDVKYANASNPGSNLQPSTGQTSTGTSEAVSAGDLYGKNFIEIPVNVKYKFTIPAVASIVKPYIFTGPQFGLRLDKGVKDVINNLESKTFQMNWNVGLGVQLINHLQVSASYAIGCNNIVKNLTTATTGIKTSDKKVKNNYWTVTAAWLF